MNKVKQIYAELRRRLCQYNTIYIRSWKRND